MSKLELDEILARQLLLSSDEADVTSDILWLYDTKSRSVEKYIKKWLKQQLKATDFKGEEYHLKIQLQGSDGKPQFSGLSKVSKLDQHTRIFPLRVIYQGGNNKNKNMPSSKMLRRLTKHPDEFAVAVAEPASIATLEKLYKKTEQYEDSNADRYWYQYIAMRAILALEVAERRFVGARYRVPKLVAQEIEKSKEFKSTVEQLSKDKGQSVGQLKKQANGIFKELIATPSRFWQNTAAAFYRSTLRLGYEEKIVYNKERLEQLKHIVRSHPSAILWTHKTHMDGLVMSSLLFDEDFPAIHTLGGINMAIAGFSYMARNSGAIFIRRTFQDNALYKFILRKYLGFLMEKRFPLSWAFEGTRSRIGKLNPPRYGLLKYVIQAQTEDIGQLHCIPVAVNYDTISDVKDYIHEDQGGIKRPESLSWMVGYLRNLRKPSGRVYVDIGDPVIIDNADVANDRMALTKVAMKVGVEANRVTPITLTAGLALILLGAAPRALTREEILLTCVQLVQWCKIRNIPMTGDFNAGSEEQVEKIVTVMIQQNLLTRFDQGPEEVFRIAEEQHATAGYYRNTIVHHFVTKSLVELALYGFVQNEQTGLDGFWEEVERLRDLFKLEFFYTPKDQFRAEVGTELGCYSRNWKHHLKHSKESANILLSRMRPMVAHSALLPYVEGYSIVADMFAKTKGEKPLTIQFMNTQAFSYAKQCLLQRRITSQASVGKLLFANAFKYFEQVGLNNVELGADQLAQKRKDMSKYFQELLYRLDALRIQTAPERAMNVKKKKSK